MSRDLVELMEKKNQTYHRQANLFVAKESTTNKVTDWRRESFNGKGNDKKCNQPRSFIGYEDKRHRHRGYASKYQKEEVKKSSTLESDLEEHEEPNVILDTIARRGKISRNLNHMVNFYYQAGSHARYAVGKSRQKPRRSKKERFLQANCQFVVRPDRDYKLHSTDPDLLIDWDFVLQVRLFVHEFPSCPICLYPPRASKITKCGHVYCWPCMLHYLSLSSENGTWSKCPICSEPVCEKDLKSVSIVSVTKHLPGEKIKMRLMGKIRGDTSVNPRSLCHGGGEVHKVHSVRDMEGSTYAKLLTADEDYVHTMATMETSELAEMMSETESDTLECSFIASAIEKNTKVMSEVDYENVPFKTISCLQTTNVEGSSNAIQKEIASNNVKAYFSAFDDVVSNECSLVSEENTDQMTPCKAEIPVAAPDIDLALCDLSLSNVPDNTSKDGSKEKWKYFYQAADGQHIFMHSLNVRCLMAEYSSLEQCPDEVEAVIVDVEEYSMSEEKMRQFSYLNHLPVSCQFKIVELELHPPLVSRQSLQVVEDLIRKRKREREGRDRRDKRNAVKIQKIENKLMGYDPDSRIINSEYKKIQEEEEVFQDGSHHFPQMQRPGFEELHIGNDKKGVEGDHLGLSFAQMLRSGKARPVMKSSKSSCPSNVPPKGSDQEEDVGDVPDFSASWNADLTKKLHETLLDVKQEGRANPQGGKKKNKKGILLFATGAVGPRCK